MNKFKTERKGRVTVSRKDSLTQIRNKFNNKNIGNIVNVAVAVAVAIKDSNNSSYISFKNIIILKETDKIYNICEKIKQDPRNKLNNNGISLMVNINTPV
jgi:hypothetical protein